MHGSSIPQELLKQPKEFGGNIKRHVGCYIEEIVEGIKNGVRKINIDTDIRLAMTGAIRSSCVRNLPNLIERIFESSRSCIM